MPAAPRLSRLEIAAGVVLGTESRPRGRPGETRQSPRVALERAILPELERGRCLVSFSGGRDSSAVLAVATRLAERVGLPQPVPATIRFPGAERAAETAWQERVVAHLGLADWVRLDAGDELDCVGPVAAAALHRHGLLWPPNAHFHVPLLAEAAGGALLTGVGGDDVFGATRWSRAAAVVGGQARPEARDALRIGLAWAPRPVRRAVLRRRIAVPFSWLRSAPERAVNDALAADAAGEPLRWRARFAWRLSLRYVHVGTASLELLAADAGARIAHPLADPGFVDALAGLPRDSRYRNRDDAMRTLFPELLPPELLARPDKAAFGQVAWGPHSRAFAAGWDGSGLDPDLVDLDALRRAWPEAERDGRLLTVLQAAWLAADRGSPGEPEETLERGRE
ncbi:MAG TPA: asparagine synthase-related protein [Gaiellaceae bacterium]|jgi:asparagine synthase (glutamine-hydrolysing)|nr:asparagine synthase-related protein [Gaiellaceae bacterium]